jgi:hypothetical protein
MVATMSRIWPVRSRLTAARKAPSPTTTTPSSAGLGGGVQQLVVDADDPVATGGDAPAAYDALRVGRGGPVEGGSRRRPPVHDDRVLLRGAQPHPADVVDRAVVAVQPAEDQALAGRVQVGPPVGRGLRADVALVDRLRGLAGRPHALGLALQRLRTQHLQPGQRAVQHVLLARQLAVQLGAQRGARGGPGGRAGVDGHRDILPGAAPGSAGGAGRHGRGPGGRHGGRGGQPRRPVASTSTQRGHRWTSRVTKYTPWAAHRLHDGRRRGSGAGRGAGAPLRPARMAAREAERTSGLAGRGAVAASQRRRSSAAATSWARTASGQGPASSCSSSPRRWTASAATLPCAGAAPTRWRSWPGPPAGRQQPVEQRCDVRSVQLAHQQRGQVAEDVGVDGGAPVHEQDRTTRV